ncbi:MAG: hypothetical protein H9W81_05770 [Enterococcus sp.]|nr:hypothetical protein [Enterococcus sp.]
MKTYTELVSDLREYIEATKPLKERFYEFIATNSCSDIPGIPEYQITDSEGYDSGGHYGIPTPVPVERYQLDFQYYLSSMYPQEENDTTPPTIPLGARYQSITYDYDYTSIYEFFIPEAYMEDPDAWEADVLKRIEAREQLAALVMKTVLPELPPLEPNSAYYSTHDVPPWSYRDKHCLHLIISLPGVETANNDEDDEVWHYLSVDLLTGDVQYEGDQIDTAINIHNVLVENGYNFAITTHYTGEEYVELNPVK